MRATKIGVKTLPPSNQNKEWTLPSKGLGVLAAQQIYKNGFICEYIGERTTQEESCLRLPNLTYSIGYEEKNDMVKGGMLLRTRRRKSSESEKRMQEMFMGKKVIGLFVDRMPGKGLGVVAQQHFFPRILFVNTSGNVFRWRNPVFGYQIWPRNRASIY